MRAEDHDMAESRRQLGVAEINAGINDARDLTQAVKPL